MSSYQLVEEADRLACWGEMKYFRRVETMDQIYAFVAKLGKCTYRRTFTVYHRHDAAKEPFVRIVTEKGVTLSVTDVGDQRKDHEKDLDYGQWKRLHRNRQYGRDAGDLKEWIKTEHSEFDRNVAKRQRMRGKETKNWLHKR